jgi:hypothetical protein
MKRLLSFVLAFLLASSALADDITRLSYDSVTKVLNAQTRSGTTATVGLGVTDGSSACTGCIGEYLVGTRAVGSALSIGSGGTNSNVAKSVASVTLTSGDWDISAIYCFTAGAITGSQIVGAITSVTDSFTGSSRGDSRADLPVVPTAATDACITIPPTRVSVSSLGSATQAYYATGSITYTAGTVTAFGKISARRVR